MNIAEIHTYTINGRLTEEMENIMDEYLSNGIEQCDGAM